MKLPIFYAQPKNVRLFPNDFRVKETYDRNFLNINSKGRTFVEVILRNGRPWPVPHYDPTRVFQEVYAELCGLYTYFNLKYGTDHKF